jgi:hypothetical protein
MVNLPGRPKGQPECASVRQRSAAGLDERQGNEDPSSLQLMPRSFCTKWETSLKAVLFRRQTTTAAPTREAMLWLSLPAFGAKVWDSR